ncbi:hypothetical protein AB1Y20_007933 [Prymnesium parvum]|uniref:Uncharacterized protein n=1 Tax=Prymnesium parvum TaxID=97485 RepID=A0AB34IVA0_PRYPA
MASRELRRRCERLGVPTDGLLEKEDWERALREAEERAGGSGATTAAAAAEDEEEELRQALLMSEETADRLIQLPTGELLARCSARGISTAGLSEKREIVAALLGEERAGSSPTPPATTSKPAAARGEADAAIVVLAAFQQRFSCHEAAEDSLDPSGGKVLLPHSCLTILAMALGELPATLLLRLTFHESSVYVSVADFIDDEKALSLYRADAPPHPPLHPPPPWVNGSLAAVFVPRWVRSSLGCAKGAPLQLAVVSLPKATALKLQPHTDGFVAAVHAQGDDVREVLTSLLNRLTAVGVGDVLSLRLGGERHAVDVLGVRGLPAVRCGQPGPAGFDVGAALLAADGAEAGGGVSVRAACIVDADVELELVESCESEGRAKRARAAAQEAAAHTAAEASRAADACSAANGGGGNVLGADPQVARETEGLSEREKRIAALERRGLR